jgi:hypothetical protein
MTDQVPEITSEVTGPGEEPNYRQLVVLLILVLVLTFAGLRGDFTSLTIPLSGTLYFTATVENYGDTPVRTSGPEPGTAYTSRQNFSTLEWYQPNGAWRFGLDFEENPGYPYPFRWSLGQHDELEAVVKGNDVFHYLMPGQRVTISGAIQILDKPPRNPFYLWAELSTRESKSSR